MLLGTIEELGDHYNLLTELLNISNDKVGPQEAMEIAIPEPEEAFAPFEPYDAEHLKPNSPVGRPPTFRAGANGASIPECMYCPAPLYSNAARKAKYMGTVVLDVIVSEKGRATDIRVQKGVPFGMNEMSIKTVGDWRFKPATYEGKPIPARVPIEVTFRLF